MKKLTTSSLVILLTSAGSMAIAQQPPAAAPAASPAAAPAAAPGASPRPMRPQTPPATGAMLDLANALADAINKQDAAALQKMMADDAVYLDEDGHAPSVARWIGALTNVPAGGVAKKIEISSTHGGMWDNAGWVSFNYVLTETANGEPRTVRGTASVMTRKLATGEWKIQMIHGALYAKVAGLTDAAK